MHLLVGLFQAYIHVHNIESRLKGILKNKTKPRGLPLSVEGHVNHLIKVRQLKPNKKYSIYV